MKSWKCACTTFDLPNDAEPLPCPVCLEKPKRVYKVNVNYHPSKGAR